MEENNITASPVTSDEDKNILHSDDMSLSLRISSFESDKEFDKFIKCVEKLVRFSVEYKYWTQFITITLGYNECALTKEVMTETNIDIHHHPISLFRICRAMTQKFLDDKKTFCTYDIAMRVIELHFKNKVGYIPLLSDIHKKYHDGYQQIPIELVHGDYNFIIKNYPLNEEDIEAVSDLKNIHLKDFKKPTWSKDNYPGLNQNLDLGNEFGMN